MFKTINLRSTARSDMIDITEQVQIAIRESGIKNGICIIFTPHTTGAITINENADPDVKIDMVNGTNKVVPQDFGYVHMEGNSDSHIKSSFVGASELLLIEDERLILGTWQGVYFCEFDGPRSRRVHIKIMEG